mgnify:CR=1 FL=1
MDRWNATYDLPSAEPGRRWDPDAQVRLRLTVRAEGPTADETARAARGRLDAWLRTLTDLEPAPAGHGGGNGGAWVARFGVGTASEPLIVEVHSAGEDGVESASTTADEVADLLDGLDLRGTWEALPLTW